MGIVGQYLTKTYQETKHRPIIILKESSTGKEGEKRKGAVYEKTSA